MYKEPTLLERLEASEIKGLVEFDVPAELRLTARDVHEAALRMEASQNRNTTMLAVSARSAGRICAV